MPFPIPRPISGSRFAPKISMMIMRMMMSSGMPTRPNMVAPFSYDGDEEPSDLTTSGWRPRLAMCAMAAVLSSLARAPLAEGRQFASGVNVVEVYAAVVDKAGNPVQGLKREDFTVLEDGRPQALATLGAGEFALSV